MINKERGISLYFAVAALSLLLAGCAGTVKNMRTVPPGEIISSPEDGKSMIVFMRPNTLGFAIQSSVFEIAEDDAFLVGIVAAKKKVSYTVEPGEHLFMVVGESADFMSADLEANKTYYALVTPRMRMWKARFSLKPIHSSDLGSPEFNDWLEACEWVEKSPESDGWASSNMASIQSKQHEYYANWMKKDPADRPSLFPEDGQNSLTQAVE